MTSIDKDFRFMATNDLMSELQRENITWDDDSETKVTYQIIGLLKDKNGEVQNLAVKCLGYLVGKIKDDRRQLVIKSLCLMLKNEMEETRDIASIALKTIVAEIPLSKKMIDIVNEDLIPHLLNAIANNRDVNVQLESLDILTVLITRLGTQIGVFHDRIQQTLLRQLKSERSSVRKRSMNALSHLLACCLDELFNVTIASFHHALTGMLEYEVVLFKIFEITSDRMSKADVDLEIKEKSITRMSQIIASFEDKMSDELPQALELLHERLNNENTLLARSFLIV